tara:strand:- start:10350 stop:11762 length:1413 start_codon:yes stop_codon:yes gene_type:complete
MALITSSNLSLKVVAKTKNNTTYSITGVAVPQKFRVKSSRRIAGNTTITDGHVTKNYTTSTSLSRADTGTINEVVTYTLSATMPLNKLVTIATISLAPNSSYTLLNKPGVALKSNIDGLKVFIEETDTVNIYNLACKIEREISVIDNAIVDLNYLVSKIPDVTSTNTIKRIITGSSRIPLSGCERLIKIYGSPNTPFEFSVLDDNDVSIISGPNATSVLPSGVKDVKSAKLNRKGFYGFRQNFPGTKVVLNTALNGSKTNVSQITFDSLTGVAVGDEFVATDTKGKKINDGETIKVISIDSTYVCTLSSIITLADNKKVSFRRGANYKLNLETTGTKGPSINATYPTYTKTQTIGTVATFNATTTDGSVRINSASPGATYSVGYGSRLNEGSRRILLTYTLTNRTITSRAGHPAFSDFVVASGDARISGNIANVSGSGTSSYVITIELNIIYGTTDTVININMDNIVTYS